MARISHPSHPTTAAGGIAARLRWLVVLLAAVVAAGCVSEEQEQRLGDTIAADINRQIPLVRDPLLVTYVNRLGNRIAQVSERPEVPYRFYIINSAVVNAFALPGGHIYVTRGLIQRTTNAAELSGVLAHEVAHVAARHGAQALERELRTGSVMSMVYQLILGREPAILDQRALQIGGRLWFASHSRRAEREADRLAVRYMIAAGLQPDGMLSLLGTLLEEEADLPQQSVEWFSTHPTTDERLRILQRKVDQLEAEIPHDLAEDLASYPAFLMRVQALPPPPDLFR